MTDDISQPVPRSTPPRSTGLTCVIDTGAGLAHIADQLDLVGDLVDVAKLGWGTSLVTNRLADKLALYRDHDVRPCFGGTLFEVFYARDDVDGYKRFLAEHDMDIVEISDGTIAISPEAKAEIVADFARDYQVLSEVGSKDSKEVVAPNRWVAEILGDLEAGASHVILEGRETGTAGLYRESGEMRTGLVTEVLDAPVKAEQLIFEAPQKKHQAYLVKLLGANVNLANIALHDVIPVETLRRGLRSDTLVYFHGGGDDG